MAFGHYAILVLAAWLGSGVAMRLLTMPRSRATDTPMRIIITALLLLLLLLAYQLGRW